MDFSYLIELAKDNDKSNKQEASKQRFSTKVSKAKRVGKPGPNVAAVQAVLKKMEDDKHKENAEFLEKKRNLLALRAQDKKSNKRVKAMINMSKGASKAVLEEAKDLTTAKGEEQCDEDDYGYESAMSQNIFKKLAGQYAESPLDDKLKFSKNSGKSARNINDIKSRVINSLKKEEEEEMGPRKRKRKRKRSDGEFDDFINDGDAYDDSAPGTSEKSAPPSTPKEKVVNINLTNYKSDRYNNFKYDQQDGSEAKSKKREREEEKPKKPKPKAGPPPMSFEELLKVAQKKQKDPVLDIREEKLKEKEKKDKKKESDRPLTAKEKEELEDERRRKLRRLGKLPPEKKDPAKEESKNTATDKQTKNGENKHKQSSSSKLREQLESPNPEPKVIDRSKYFAVPFAQKSNNPPQTKDSKPQTARAPPPQLKQQPYKPTQSKVQLPSIRQEPSKNAKPQKPTREMPQQRDMKPGMPPHKFPQKDRGRPFLPPDMRRRPPTSPPQAKRRIESDEEEDYDSEMDDFIDDGEAELDYRSEIGKLFGYDRNRYQDDEDDLSDMEASYSQMQKEERISAKIGLREDLEDIQREEEEKKLKMKRLKMMKKGKR